MTTPTWDDLPTVVRARLENDLAPTGPAVPLAGGFTAGVRVHLPTDDGAVFIKAIRSISGAADMYRAEAAANQALPSGIGPQLLTSFEDDGWVVLAFDFVTGRHPDLTPGSPDLQSVIDAIGQLHDSLTPCPLRDAPRDRQQPGP